MNLNEYQTEATTTANYPEELGVIYNALGLTGEAGEVANKVKKVIRDHDGRLSEDKKKELKAELGDCLWYISQLARELGYTLDEVGVENIEKLHSRQVRGTISGSGDTR
jgi:NTP pyrophosphatase (non-canonical NTP hydrolase)